MNNYDKMLADACRRFTAYDMQALAQRPGVEDIGACLKTCFLGETALLRKRDGCITVGGSGLVMSGGAQAKRIDAEPHRVRAACHAIGGREVALGDLGFEIPVFPGVAMCLKFYFGDEEFPPQLTFLWDKNMLQFVRYETVYYIAGCVQKRLLG